MNSLFSLCSSIADSDWFKNAITITILFAGVLIGIETYLDFASEHKSVLHFLDQLILLIFIVEIIVKILAEGTKPWRYFMDSWNIFDFCHCGSRIHAIWRKLHCNFKAVKITSCIKTCKGITQTSATGKCLTQKHTIYGLCFFTIVASILYLCGCGCYFFWGK